MLKSKKTSSHFLLQGILLICLGLNMAIVLIYRPVHWPFGNESSAALAGFLTLLATWFMLRQFRGRPGAVAQYAGIQYGLLVGLLWTLEISINNFIQPALPGRDRLDDLLWGIITLLLLGKIVRDAYRATSINTGIKTGFWTGLASGAVACVTALLIVVFGMKCLTADPVNLQEWAAVKASTYTPGMAVYFAYQTLAGAFLHLYGLGMVAGLALGFFGGILGWASSRIRKRIQG